MNIISPSLCDIFTPISPNQFTDDLKIAKVAAVFKAGERDDLNNYRPISVLPTVARVFEKLIYKQLYDYFTVNNLLGNKQYGFRSLQSTALALGNLTNTWLLNTDNGKMNSVVFLDIKKAFDTVDHKILIDKLYSYGVVEQELKFFRSDLTDRVQCCSLNGVSSGFKNRTCGVHQGSLLGPLLFIVHMNDLSSAAKDVNITMFADDTSLNQEIKTASNIMDDLIPVFGKVCEWLRHNNFSLNAIKTEFMIIGSHQRVGRLDSTPESTPYIIQVDDLMIKRVTKVKYLGLVDKILSWDEHVEHI